MHRGCRFTQQPEEEEEEEEERKGGMGLQSSGNNIFGALIAEREIVRKTETRNLHKFTNVYWEINRIFIHYQFSSVSKFTTDLCTRSCITIRNFFFAADIS